AQPGIEATNVSGSQCQQSARFQIAACLSNVQIWPAEVLDCVPHRDDPEFSAKIVAEIVALMGIDLHPLAREFDSVVGQVQPGRCPPRASDFIQKKTCRAANLEQIPARKVGRDFTQRRYACAKVFSETSLLLDVVQILAAMKIVFAVDVFQFTVRQICICGYKPAPVTLNQPLPPTRNLWRSANQAILIGDAAFQHLGHKVVSLKSADRAIGRSRYAENRARPGP